MGGNPLCQRRAECSDRIRAIDKGAYDSYAPKDFLRFGGTSEFGKALGFSTHTDKISRVVLPIITAQIKIFGSGYTLLGNMMTPKMDQDPPTQGSPGYANPACTIGVDLESCEDRSRVRAHRPSAFMRPLARKYTRNRTASRPRSYRIEGYADTGRREYHQTECSYAGRSREDHYREA